MFGLPGTSYISLARSPTAIILSVRRSMQQQMVRLPQSCRADNDGIGCAGPSYVLLKENNPISFNIKSRILEIK